MGCGAGTASGRTRRGAGGAGRTAGAGALCAGARTMGAGAGAPGTSRWAGTAGAGAGRRAALALWRTVPAGDGDGDGDGPAFAFDGVTRAGGEAGTAGCPAKQAPSNSVVPSAAAAYARREIFIVGSWGRPAFRGRAVPRTVPAAQRFNPNHGFRTRGFEGGELKGGRRRTTCKEADMSDREAELLRSLHEAYGPALWRFVMRMTGDSTVADDVVQETLIRAWQHPAILQRPDAAVKAWLYTVARNLVIDDRRSARRRHETRGDELPEIPEADRVDRILDEWLVADALAGLSAEHRAVIIHSYYRRETTAEIAQSLQLAEGTVKSRLHYALRALRLALQEGGVTP